MPVLDDLVRDTGWSSSTSPVRDDPAAERPRAFVRALRSALAGHADAPTERSSS